MNRPASAPDQGWRNSALHREVDNRHALWVFKIVVGVAIALVPFAAYLLQTMSYVETSYAIEDLRGAEARLIDAERRLTIEKAVMESLPAVEKRAGVELGLEHPKSPSVIVISNTELNRPAPFEAASHQPAAH